jgi:hypothetical protein
MARAKYESALTFMLRDMAINGALHENYRRLLLTDNPRETALILELNQHFVPTIVIMAAHIFEKSVFFILMDMRRWNDRHKIFQPKAA